jgi:hypothetical protein
MPNGERGTAGKSGREFFLRRGSFFVPLLPKLPHHLEFLPLVAYHLPEPEMRGHTDGLWLLVIHNEGGMAKKRSTSESKAVTAERAARLYKLLRLLASGPQKRDTLIKRLRLDVRGFYRDLEVLHAADITVTLINHRYTLEENAGEAIARLPFPDPHLTLGEVQQLAKGRSKAHRKLQEQIKAIVK